MKKEKAAITLSYDEERLAALRLYLAERHLQVESELTKALDALYGKTVPQSVRHFLDMRGGVERPAPTPIRKPEPAPACEEVKHDGE